ncbi:tagatose 1,6-diphosphate aldolase [Chloroflexota bacterium]
MNTLYVGKLRGLQQLADPEGMLTVCALDHRGSLKRALEENRSDGVSYQDMVDFKLDLCRAIAPFASAVLLDPVYGAAPAIVSGVLPGSTGLLVSLEKTGYIGESTARITELLPDWSVDKIKRLGASAVKLLIYFRPDSKDVAVKQLDLVARVAEQCIENDIPLLVESVAYPLAGETDKPEEFSRKKPELVIEAARKLTALPIDVLKSEFPGDLNYEKDESKLEAFCRELNEASRLPWVILSAGVNFELFRKQVEVASKAGASGFLAGRALWQEASGFRSRKERMNFFKDKTVPRIKEIAGIADKLGKPWYAKMGAENGQFLPVAEDWYKSY